MPKQKTTTKKKIVKKSGSKKTLKSREHLHFQGLIALVSGFSVYAISSFVFSTSDYVNYMEANVLGADDASHVAVMENVDNIVIEDFSENPFADLDSGHMNSEAVVYLYGQGVVSGDEFGNFNPDKLMTRAEAVKTAMEAAKVELLETDVVENCFADVRTLDEHWFAAHVCAAKERGIISGADNFYPGEPVTKAAALKIVMGAFGLEIVDSTEVVELPYFDVDANDWYLGLAYSAYAGGIIPGGDTFGADTPVTRAAFAQMVVNAMANL